MGETNGRARRDRGVSSTIGTVLMVATTVLVATAVVGVVVALGEGRIDTVERAIRAVPGI